MVKRPTTPFSHGAHPAVRQKLEMADPTGQSMATISSDPASTLGLTDQQHQDFDHQILEVLGDEPETDLSDFVATAVLFTAFFSNGTLWLSIKEVEVLLYEHPELEKDVEEALKSGSFRKIRETIRQWKVKRLGGVPLSRTDTSVSNDAQAFQQPYQGSAVDGFYNYLKDNDKKFDNDPEYYAKFCSIVQSSGTGKTRLICELSQKGVLVLYINLREEKDRVGFPARDTIPADILTNFTNVNEEEYTKRCHAFFVALFIGLGEAISCDGDNFIQAWNDRMNWQCEEDVCATKRRQFFTQVQKHYMDIRTEMLQLEEDGMKKMVSVFEHAQSLLREKLQGSKKISGPILVIAFDEAHTLTPTQPKIWRPSVVFCKAIAKFSRQSLGCWVVFASTTSKVADFAAPLIKFPSARVAISGELLFPPYTKLGWDQKAVPLDDIPVDENAKVKYIAGFGRPLWTSIGGDPDKMLQIAQDKLCPRNPEAGAANHLAVLAQRFGLDVYFHHKEAVLFVEDAIVNHARICLGISENRMGSFTSYPSEPFLSCAAAQILHHSPHDRKRILQTLIEKAKIGLIEVGRTGELANRLLWLLAKDLLVRETLQVPFLPLPDGEGFSLESQLADCKGILVIDYLKYVFGESFWSTVAPGAEHLFAKAYINFSHWVAMKSEIGKRKGMSESEWMMRLWKRTCAIQCSHQQKAVDAMIPIYFNLPDLPLAQRTSQLFISVKFTVHSNRSDLNFILRDDPEIDCSTSGRPWIAILVDYGLNKSEVTAEVTPGRISEHLNDQRQVDDNKCLRIYTAGMSPNTFKFLKDQELLILQELVNFENPIQQEEPVALHLGERMEFGSDAGGNCMKWEENL